MLVLRPQQLSKGQEENQVHAVRFHTSWIKHVQRRDHHRYNKNWLRCNRYKCEEEANQQHVDRRLLKSKVEL